MSDQLLTVVSLLALGLVLVALEVFVIPGVGLVGVGGALALVIGSTLSWLWFGADAGALALLVSVVGPSLLLFGFARSSAGKKLVLDSALRGRSDVEQPALRVGVEGRALTPLRPSGTAQFGPHRADVVTDGIYVEAGEPVRIVELSGARIVVARVAAETPITRTS
jgi:membrane-bound ClpP family serine protease